MNEFVNHQYIPELNIRYEVAPDAKYGRYFYHVKVFRLDEHGQKHTS